MARGAWTYLLHVKRHLAAPGEGFAPSQNAEVALVEDGEVTPNLLWERDLAPCSTRQLPGHRGSSSSCGTHDSTDGD